MKLYKWHLFLIFGILLILVSSTAGCITVTPSAPTETPIESPGTPSAPNPLKSPPKQPLGVPWNNAKDHIGERITVCGPVVDTKWARDSEGKPTFLNVGNPSPSSNRFDVIILEQYRTNFPEPPDIYFSDKFICVNGLITEHEGIPQIEVQNEIQIKIQ